MSHLIKNKKIIFYIKFLFSVLLLSIFFKSLLEYNGKKITYFLFSIISFYLIFFSLRKKAFFFETFFSFYLFMGFWLKFSIILIFDLGFGEGVNNNNIEYFFDYALTVSSIGFLGFIIAGHIREFFFSYPSKIEKPLKNEFYQKYRILILTIFFSFVLIVSLLNWNLKIYQRGLASQEYNFIFDGSIKMLLLFGFSLFSSIILFTEFTSFKKIFRFTIIIVFLEAFVSSLSMMSRGMFFNIGSLFFGLYKFSNKIKIILNLNFFLKIFLILFVFSYVSINTVNFLRINYYSTKDKQENKLNLQQNNFKNLNELKELEKNDFSFKEFNSLFIHRWVGIDAVLVVSSHKELLNFPFLTESLGEKFSFDKHSFYETKFNLKPLNLFSLSKTVKGNTLPGIIAFLFYSGSFFFLFIAMMLITFFSFVLEFISYKLLKQNLLFSAVVGQIIAYRFVHFGYLPSQSYLLFGSLIGLILIIYLLRIMFKN